MSQNVETTACLLLLFVAKLISGNWIKLQGDDVGNQPSQYQDSKSILPGSRAAAATWSDQFGNLWMFGGQGFANETTEMPASLNEFWLYNGTSHKWHLITNNDESDNQGSGNRYVPIPRKGASACGVHDVIFVIFGGEVHSNHKLNDTWIYDIQNKTWIPLFKATEHPMNPPPRSHAGSWCLNDHFIIYGGAGKDGLILDDMWQFDMKTFTWNLMRQHVNAIQGKTLPPGRMGSSTWTDESHIYMFGGSTLAVTTALHKQSSHNILSDFWQYDLSNETWILLLSESTDSSKAKQVSPNGRMFAGSWKADNDLYLLGGYGINSNKADDIDFMLDLWKYDINQTSWHSITLNNEDKLEDSNLNDNNKEKVKLQLPTKRCCASIWAHRHFLFVFGGLGYDLRTHVTYLNDLFVSVNNADTLEFFHMHSETAIQRMVRELSPPVIFAICFASFGGVVFIFGAMFFLKKMIDYPSHAPPKGGYNVKYSPVNDDISMET